MQSVQEKYKNLQEYLKSLGSVAVAFSSGVDSTFLLAAAKETLGADHVIAVTASSCSFPKRELEEAKQFCKEQGIRHIVCKSEELDIEGFRQNPKNRCYLCKHELFEKILEIAKEYHINAVAEGSNMDDNGDYRPGLVASCRAWYQKSAQGGFVEQRRDPYTFQRDGTAHLGQAVICMPFLPVCLWGDNFRRKTRHGG